MVQAGGRRAQMSEELIAMADQFLAQWDSAETLLDDTAKNYTAKKLEQADGIAVVMIKYRCDGLTED